MSKSREVGFGIFTVFAIGEPRGKAWGCIFGGQSAGFCRRMIWGVGAASREGELHDEFYVDEEALKDLLVSLYYVEKQ